MLCCAHWRLEYRLQASRRPHYLHGTASALALTAIIFSHAPAAWKWAALAWLLFQLGTTVLANTVRASTTRNVTTRATTSAAIRALRSIPDGWRLTLEDGSLAYAGLVGPVRDWPGLLCLQFIEHVEDTAVGSSPRRWRLLLWSDQLTASEWRRFRVSVLWRRPGPEMTWARDELGVEPALVSRSAR